MHSNISQILLLYKTWRYHNKFDSPKSLGGMLLMCHNTTVRVYGPWIKTYSVLCSKRVVAMDISYNPALVRDKSLGAPASVKRAYWSAPMRTPSFPQGTQYYDSKRGDLIEGVSKCMISRQKPRLGSTSIVTLKDYTMMSTLMAPKCTKDLGSGSHTVGHRRQVTAVTRLPRWRRRKTRFQGRPLLTML